MEHFKKLLRIVFGVKGGIRLHVFRERDWIRIQYLEIEFKREVPEVIHRFRAHILDM